MENRKVPTLQEIVEGNIPKSDYQKLIDSNPPNEFIEEREFKNVDGKKEVLPIVPYDKMKILLDGIYGYDGWRTEPTREHVTKSSTARNEYSTLFISKCEIRNPDTGIWETYFGTGADSTMNGNSSSIQQCAQYSLESSVMNGFRRIGRVFGGSTIKEFKKEQEGQEKAKKQEESTEEEKPSIANLIIQEIRKNNSGNFERIKKNRDYQLYHGLISESELESINLEIDFKLECLKSDSHIEIKEPKKRGRKPKEKPIVNFDSLLSEISLMRSSRSVNNTLSQIDFLLKAKKLNESEVDLLTEALNFRLEELKTQKKNG